MPLIGWVFLLLAIALVVGSLLMLRDSANKFPISDEKMRKIQARNLAQRCGSYENLKW